jgi:hypothetical protein
MPCVTYAECHLCSVTCEPYMLSVVMLNVVMLSVVSKDFRLQHQRANTYYVKSSGNKFVTNFFTNFSDKGGIIVRGITTFKVVLYS